MKNCECFSDADLPAEVPERLEFYEPRGWYRYGRIPYKIFYSLETQTGSLVNGRNPGRFKVTPDSGGGGVSLSIWIHESVIGEFKDIVMFHELREAELIFAEGLTNCEAHEQSARETKNYAKEHLSEDEYEMFIEWEMTLDDY